MTRIRLALRSMLRSVRFRSPVHAHPAGEVVEDGCHEDLLSLNGFYSELYMAQAQGFVQ
jgi:hypothetical protein